MANFAKRLADGLFNALSGMGGQSDPRAATVYGFVPLPAEAIVSAYRASALMRKVVRIPALDAVRSWREWQADADQIERIEEEEERHGIRAKVLQAEVYRGLGGGALILGLPGDPAMPASRSLGKGSLAFVQVVSRYKLNGVNWIDDPTIDDYGGPEYWTIATTRGHVRLHPSRVIPFPGEPIPDVIGVGQEEAFWGDSRVQTVLDVVKDADTARQAFASLIHKARLTKIGIPGLLDITATSEGEQALTRRMQSFMMAEGLFSALVYDAGTKNETGESIDHENMSWTGIPDVMRAFAESVSAAADIPMTRLYGRAAEGMNSSGESQQRDWNKMVASRQELELRPCLERLDDALVPSALGSRPADVWWKFASLDVPGQAEETERFKTTMEAVEKVQNTGAIPDHAFAKAVQNTLVENGWMPGLEGALDEIPEEERYGLAPDLDGIEEEPDDPASDPALPGS